MGNKVKVTSYTEGKVRFYLPELRVNRLFEKYGQSYLFDADTLEEMFYYPSVEKLFRNGLFKIEDKELNVKLGLEEEDGEPAQEVIAPISDSTILAYLKIKTADEFKTFVEELPREQQNRFVDMAIKNKITDYEKVTFLKKITGRDVIKIIEINASDEE